jgi:hypothetical protein
MKVITLTADQKTALTPLKAALDAAATPFAVAQAAYEAEVQAILTAANVAERHPRAVLSDDGNALIIR